MVQSLAFYERNSANSLERHYAKAKRHSKHVSFMHILLPSLLVIFVAGILLMTFAQRLILQLPFNIDGLVVSGSKISMLSPNLTGYMKDNRAYSVKADRAEQDLKTPTLVDLFNMHGVFDLENGGKATLKAVSGTMQSDKELISFKEGVTVETTSGHFAKTSEAFVNAKAGLITAPNAVYLKMPTGEMTAASMEIRDSGKYMLFERDVKGFFIPASSDNNPDIQKEKP
jgi:lipopolysaccharide export system protein LptC